ncbi:MAG: cache domain-containing protein [Magnetococcales bacterium]|nr:cache domain-containing protein [Magnetococcales bacterium]
MLVAGRTSTAAEVADEMGTVFEARTLCRKAMITLYKIGSEQAFKQFSDPNGGFLEKDLYVFCMDKDGVMLSHAENPELVGQNMINFNQYGEPLFQEMVNLARTTREGWISYHWPYPGTGEVREKLSYIIAHPSGFFCGVGAYKELENQ